VRTAAIKNRLIVFSFAGCHHGSVLPGIVTASGGWIHGEGLL
jgi:hypothetical protein